VVAVVALGVGSLASSVVLATGNGRDTNNCVQACNVLRDQCYSACDSACSMLYTPGSAAYTSCYSSCQFDCDQEKQVCKGKCNSGKGNPGSPTEP